MLQHNVKPNNERDILGQLDKLFMETVDQMSQRRSMMPLLKYDYRSHVADNGTIRCRITVSSVKIEVKMYTADYDMILNIGYDKKSGQYIGLTQTTMPFKRYLDTVIMFDQMDVL